MTLLCHYGCSDHKKHIAQITVSSVNAARVTKINLSAETDLSLW